MSTVTYSPEDNKLRLYVGRVPRADYEALRKAGWTSTPKQSCDFVATWTPAREDQASEYLEEGEEIGDEDYSPEERSADRAERFGEYLDKRRAEAGDAADTHAAGPQAFGHQNRDRAERQARRHDRHRTYAASQWSKAEYWQRRTAGVISHALYKSSAHVRRGRILTLEAEQRKHEKSRAEYREIWQEWQTVAALEDADRVPNFALDRHAFAEAAPAWIKAYSLASRSYEWGEYKHPRKDKKTSLYTLLKDEEDPITAREAYDLWSDGRIHPDDETTSSARWSRHYELRLTYEKAMLAQEGGMMGDADIIPGGFIRGELRRKPGEFGEWRQIIRVYKSPATGRVTSVSIMTTSYSDRYGNPYPDGKPRQEEARISTERMGEGGYRPPTEPELKEFQAAQKIAKAEAKATKKPEPALINPTKADAQRLQALWNARAKKKNSRAEDQEIFEMTQAQYSARSKGTYSSFETRNVDTEGKASRQSSNMWTSEGAAHDKAMKATICKVRVGPSRGFYDCERVIYITDKPAKALPFNWKALEAQGAEQETAAA